MVDLQKALRELDERTKRIEELEKVLKRKNKELKKAVRKKNEELKKVAKEMNDKVEELEQLEDMNSVLLVKERLSNDEVQQARKELIKGLRDLSDDDGTTIKVKRMGEVDAKPFMEACKQRFSSQNVEMEQAMLCSKWQNTIKDPAWYPFKRVGTGEKMKEVVDEEDEKLKNLSEEWGEDVKNSVKTALQEMNEYAGGRFTVSVLWNLEQGRQATLKEGIVQMMQHVRHLKRKRT